VWFSLEKKRAFLRSKKALYERPIRQVN